MSLSFKSRRLRSSTVFVVTVVSLSVFTNNLAYGVVTPILPRVLRQIPEIRDEDVQNWIFRLLTSFGLSFLLMSPIGGQLADHGNRRKLCLAGSLPAIVAGLLLFMTSRSSPVAMCVARVLQGISSAVIGTSGLALVMDTMGTEQAALGVGFISMSTTLSTAAAPILGGLLYDRCGYLFVFLPSFGLICLDVLMVAMMIEKKEREKVDSSTEPGNDESAPLLNPDAAAREDRWHYDGRELGRLLRNLRLANAVSVVIFVLCMFAILETTLPWFLWKRFALSPTKTGFLLLACSLPKATAPIFGKMIDRYGARTPVTVALLVCSASFASLRGVGSNSDGDMAFLIVLLILGNLAISVVELAMMSEIGVVATEQGKSARGGALINMALAIGLMLGPFIGGFVIEKAGWEGVTLALGFIPLLGLPGTLAYTGTP